VHIGVLSISVGLKGPGKNSQSRRTRYPSSNSSWLAASSSLKAKPLRPITAHPKKKTSQTIKVWRNWRWRY